MELDYTQDLVVASTYFDGIREGEFVTARSDAAHLRPSIALALLFHIVRIPLLRPGDTSPSAIIPREFGNA